MKELKQKIKTAFDEADSILICAGAGMSADSGIPTFRDKGGLWTPTGPLAKLGKTFQELSDISMFHEDPTLAWGIFGFRTQMFRSATPSQAFHDIQTLASRKEHGEFIITSNIDGMFQRSGISDRKIWEIHGSIEWHTTMTGMGEWSAQDFRPKFDPDTLRLTSALPTSPTTGEPARPMVIMFQDDLFSGTIGRMRRQEERFHDWFRDTERPLILTIGAGDTIRSIQLMSERFQCRKQSWLIHIDPDSRIRSLGACGKDGMGIRLQCGTDEGLRTILDSI